MNKEGFADELRPFTEEDRLNDLRSWAALVMASPKNRRLTMSGVEYAHWADVAFLLDQLDAALAAGPPTASLPAQIDPANFCDTITMTPSEIASVLAPYSSTQTPPTLKVVRPRTPQPDADVWNDAVSRTIALVELTLNDCRRERADHLTIRDRVVKVMNGCRKPVDVWEGAR